MAGCKPTRTAVIASSWPRRAEIKKNLYRKFADATWIVLFLFTVKRA
jgi:hypothetical protein